MGHDATQRMRHAAEAHGMNFHYSGGTIGITLDETTTQENVMDILSVFGHTAGNDLISAIFDLDETLVNIPSPVTRVSEFMTHPVFNSYHSEEAKMMRYLQKH